MNHVTGLLDVLRQSADGRAGTVNHLGAGRRFAVRAAGCLGGALGVACHFLHADRHLVDRRGDLISFALLACSALRAAVHRTEQFVGMLAELTRGITNPADHGAGLGFQHLHGKGDLAEFITPTGIDQLPHRVVTDPACLLGEALQRCQRDIGHCTCTQQGGSGGGQRSDQTRSTEQGAGDHARRGTQRRQKRDATAGAQRCTTQRRRRTLVAQLRVQLLGGCDLSRRGLGAYRLVFDDPTVAADRRDERADPVVIAVLAAVLHHTHP